MEDWEWCGHAHHFIGADDCRFHLATWVAGGCYLVSTVGDYWPHGATKMETIVFKADPENRHAESGHPTVIDWGEVVGEPCATHEEANVMHVRYCHEFGAKLSR